MKRILLLSCIGLFACLAAPLLADEVATRPNILFIVADDLGWQDVGWHGGQFKTPVLDGLVRTGVELDRHYVQPVCTPTRTALLSGRWTGRFGPHALSPSNRRVFPPGTVTLASALQEMGYATHIAGKWHLGSKPEWGPNHYGFDHSYGSLNGAVDPWTHLYRPGPYLETWHRDCRIMKEEGNATELVTQEALGWIRQKSDPWFIFLAFHAVHIPIDCPEEYKQLYEGVTFDEDPLRDDALRRMAGFVSQLDSNVGRLVNALEETGQRENTLIVFTSDNGGLPGGKNPYVGDVPDSPVISSNVPLRGHKGMLYEGGIRVCAFANWPPVLEPRTVTASIHAADWMPTLTRLAGWEHREEVPFDGSDVWPLLTGDVDSIEPRSIYIPLPRGQVLLRDGWKLITSRNRPRPELYHVASDPSEKNNLVLREPYRAEEMLSRLVEIQRADLTEIPADLVDEAP